jgi:nucleoside phosphorylase
MTIEADAVQAVFDVTWNDFQREKNHGDTNAYSFGTIGRYNVVLVHMAKAGKKAATQAATHCQNTFSQISLCILVGICGGIPVNTENKEPMVLGDVVISEAVIEYDLERQYSDGVERKEDTDRRPSPKLDSLLSKLRCVSEHKALQTATAAHLQELTRNQHVGHFARYPEPPIQDKLFLSTYRHRHRGDDTKCDATRKCLITTNSVCNKAIKTPCAELGCDESEVVRRVQTGAPTEIEIGGFPPQKLMPGEAVIISRSDGPAVHFGKYASGDKVMKSGEIRDSIAMLEKVIAFEMEGAGMWGLFSNCLIIKAICDYADSHKNSDFQKYAASTGAACMKAFLEFWAANV